MRTPHLHPGLLAAADAAQRAYADARANHTRAELETVVATGADGTPTMHIDQLVEAAIVEATEPHRLNVLSEELGFLDRGSDYALVVDPLDGSANAAAGVPLACFSAALADGHRFTQALTRWLETGRDWAVADATVLRGGPLQTTGHTSLAGASLSLLRPQPANQRAWNRLAETAARIRVLSCSTLESVLVLTGAVDAFADPGGDIHRLVDLAAACVLASATEAAVLDAYERPIEFDTDLTRRWSGIVAATPDLAYAIRHQVQAS
jgi:myo-inositol-1(or 4)-monophosphatase